jgi:hypothetical protein
MKIRPMRKGAFTLLLGVVLALAGCGPDSTTQDPSGNSIFVPLVCPDTQNPGPCPPSGGGDVHSESGSAGDNGARPRLPDPAPVHVNSIPDHFG